MLTGAHAVVFCQDPEKAREFFRDVLGLPSVDSGGGWLIFKLPPAEAAVHPQDAGQAGSRHELYLMCDDLDATMKELEERGAVFAGPPSEQRWGRLVSIKVPGAGEIGLYQPTHARP